MSKESARVPCARTAGGVTRSVQLFFFQSFSFAYLPFTLELIECYYLLTLVCNLFLSRACTRALPLVGKIESMDLDNKCKI